MTDTYSKGVARTAISMNAHLSEGEKKHLLATLRDDYSSKVLPELPPGILDGDVAKMFVDDPELGRHAQELLVMPDGEEKRRLLKGMRKHLHKRHREMMREKAESLRARERLNRMRDAVQDVVAWCRQPIVLQRPEGSLLPRLREAFEAGEALYPVDDHQDEMFELFEEAWQVASVFVVEHDWAAAFANATDFATGEFELPAPISVFEFRISGMPVVVTASKGDNDNLSLMTAIRTKHGWLTNGTIQRLPSGAFVARTPGETVLSPMPADDLSMQVADFVASQIRAISIALDAEVARADVVRAPHKSNQPRRDRRPLPSYSYHVVSLARRCRAERAEVDPDAPTGTRKRLHFRRGHWRHYQESKTWIRWCLVGDPDLGFVDKHYKL